MRGHESPFSVADGDVVVTAAPGEFGHGGTAAPRLSGRLRARRRCAGRGGRPVLAGGRIGAGCVAHGPVPMRPSQACGARDSGSRAQPWTGRRTPRREHGAPAASRVPALLAPPAPARAYPPLGAVRHARLARRDAVATSSHRRRFGTIIVLAAVSGRGPRAGRGYRGHAAQQSRMLDWASCATLGRSLALRRRCA